MDYLSFHTLQMYPLAASQKLPEGFEQLEEISQFDEVFIKNYEEDSNTGYFLEVGIHYAEKLHDLYNDLPFLPEGIKIGKVGKLVANFYNKKEHFIHIKQLKQPLNHELELKK